MRRSGNINNIVRKEEREIGGMLVRRHFSVKTGVMEGRLSAEARVPHLFCRTNKGIEPEKHRFLPFGAGVIGVYIV